MLLFLHITLSFLFVLQIISCYSKHFAMWLRELSIFKAHFLLFCHEPNVFHFTANLLKCKKIAFFSFFIFLLFGRGCVVCQWPDPGYIHTHKHMLAHVLSIHSSNALSQGLFFPCIPVEHPRHWPQQEPPCSSPSPGLNTKGKGKV
jgi:hypothetical protein